MDGMETKRLARIIWDYMLLGHSLEKSDCIIVLGSHDVRVAERGAELLLQDYAPVLVLSGGLGNLTRGIWTRPEAMIFKDVALKMGVPENRIIVEDASSNTGENALFSMKLLAENNIFADKVILVQKPYMERRTLATFMKHYSKVRAFVTSPRISLDDYPNSEITFDDVVNIMVGDLQRIILYSSKGFQVHQDVPTEVMDAYEKLKEAGFTRHMVA
ncbi:MAG: YdcF family protein [Victivallales bacterium]